jgi:RecA-family ATPase
MSFIYDNDGNIVGEDNTDYSATSLKDLTDKRAEELGFDALDTEEQPAPRRKFYDPEASAAMPLFRTLSLGDLDNLPDPEWVVDGVIPADAMVTVFGAPGSTKSFFALDIACSIASGHNFNDSKVKSGKVIYCVGEGLRGMKWRIEAWKLAHPEADVDRLNENLIILPRAVMLLDKTESGMLVNTAEAVNEDAPLRAFIIDTWARSLTGGDENSAQDVGIAINVCETVRAKTNASPIIIHHTGADGSRERGSTALRGATDTTIQMAHEETSGIVTVTCKKMKDGEPFAPQRYNLKPFGHSIVLSPITNTYGTQSTSYTTQVRDRDYYTRRTNNDGYNPF